MMPDLPNVGWERDVESFREFFENPAFRTDGLKVYPTLVIRGTGLYELWMKGLYKNYAPDKARCSHARIVFCHRAKLKAFIAVASLGYSPYCKARFCCVQQLQCEICCGLRVLALDVVALVVRTIMW